MSELTAEQKQAKYAASRPKLGPQYPTVAYRVWLPGREPFTTHAIGPSQIVAHHPDMIAFCIVGAEPENGMMGELWG